MEHSQVGYYLRYFNPVSQKMECAPLGKSRDFALNMRRKYVRAIEDFYLTGELILPLEPKRPEPEPEPLNFEDCLAKFYVRSSNRGGRRKKERTQKTYASCIRGFRKMFPDVDVKDVTEEMAEQFVEALQKKASPATVNKYLRHLSAFFGFCQKKGYVLSNPFEDMGKLDEGDIEVNIISYHQEQRLLQAVGTYEEWDAYLRRKLKAIVKLAVEAGLRNEEIRYLRCRDINLETGAISVTARKGWTPKSGKSRTRWVYDQGLAILRELSMEGRWQDETMPFHYTTSSSLSKIFRQIAVKAGVECTLHDLRRTCNTRIEEAVGSLAVAAEYIGDSSLPVARKHYLKLREFRLQEAGRKAIEHAKQQDLVA